MTKNIYQKPEVDIVDICLEGSVLAGSVQVDGTASGEDITYGDEFDPWG